MQSGWDAAEWLRRLQLATIEPLVLAARHRRRLDMFGVRGVADLPYAAIDLMPAARGCGDSCASQIAAERGYFRRYPSDRSPSPLLARLRGVPAVIDLDHYPSLALYADAVRQHSKGGVLRQVRKARAEGFFCKRFYGDFYRRQRFEIDTSKRFRSGLVLASLLRRPPASDFPDGVDAAQIAAYLGCPVAEPDRGLVLPEPPPPICPLHWNVDWGVFVNETGGRGSRERLVGYMQLRRTGNIVRTLAVIGHGAYLPHNVVKLLFYDVMQWLLARAEPAVDGLSWLLYGAIEHGYDGLAAWKRSFGFAPAMLRWPPT